MAAVRCGLAGWRLRLAPWMAARMAASSRAITAASAAFESSSKQTDTSLSSVGFGQPNDEGEFQPGWKQAGAYECVDHREAGPPGLGPQAARRGQLELRLSRGPVDIAPEIVLRRGKRGWIQRENMRKQIAIMKNKPNNKQALQRLTTHA